MHRCGLLSSDLCLHSALQGESANPVHHPPSPLHIPHSCLGWIALHLLLAGMQESSASSQTGSTRTAWEDADQVLCLCCRSCQTWHYGSTGAQRCCMAGTQGSGCWSRGVHMPSRCMIERPCHSFGTSRTLPPPCLSSASVLRAGSPASNLSPAAPSSFAQGHPKGLHWTQPTLGPRV